MYVILPSPYKCMDKSEQLEVLKREINYNIDSLLITNRDLFYGKWGGFKVPVNELRPIAYTRCLEHYFKEGNLTSSIVFNYAQGILFENLKED